ncbi:hypothetical protein ANCCAN_12762 [Ancylostoma caninum]|uniref:Uncharacterized protein n=1 Tax=Ancylostoma caninum TaxID=29170 RepID=A0A368GAA2_ANCCA|nr:hypothetical protein ANCCAN_12762 [Ancylostoma caninum]
MIIVYTRLQTWLMRKLCDLDVVTSKIAAAVTTCTFLVYII